MKHVINFSGGLGSFWAAHRVISEFGTEDVTILFADVLIEDEDLYRFMVDAQKVLGVGITRICHGLSPWGLFRKERMIGNSGAPICSIRLKRKMLDAWRTANCDPKDTVVYVGIDWTEEHRLTSLKSHLVGWDVRAPMVAEPLWDKCRMVSELRKLGVTPPRLYSMGFPHNNCGGFCVKAGQAQFALLLKTMPERYAHHETEEEKTREIVGDFSVMKDRRGGKAKTLTMRAFRERVESGDYVDRTDWGGCGCSMD